jgi:hypothetical protein
MARIPTKIANLFVTDVNSLREGTAGRSNRLIVARDKALCARYFYYQRYRHYNYSKTCECLSGEFYISVIMIQKQLKKNSDVLQAFRTTPLSIKELATAYPHINWVG